MVAVEKAGIAAAALLTAAALTLPVPVAVTGLTAVVLALTVYLVAGAVRFARPGGTYDTELARARAARAARAVHAHQGATDGTAA